MMALPLEVKDTLDEIGAFIEYWGFRRVDGSVWTLIYLSARPLSGQEIADLLGLSKGMVSLAINQLLAYRVIRETHRGAGRSIYYDSAENLEKVIFDVLKNRESRMLKKIVGATRQLKVRSQKEDFSKNFSEKRIHSLVKLTENGQKLFQLILTLGKLKA